MQNHFRFELALAIGALTLAFAAHANAGLLVAPKRLVFENGARHGQFVLVNKGEQTQRYRVSMVARRMTPDGRVVPLKEIPADERLAHRLIRYSPRVVTLPPNEPQIIRVMVRNPGDLESGEFRSHMVFQQLPDVHPAAPQPGAAPSGIGVRMTPIFGISVPVIVRHGQLSADAELSELRLRVEDQETWLHMRLRRDGNRSLFGHFTVWYELPDGERREVGRSKGIALYTPNQERTLSIQLPEFQGRLPNRGRLTVEYREATPGVSSLIAESALDLALP